MEPNKDERPWGDRHELLSVLISIAVLALMAWYFGANNPPAGNY